VGHHDQKLLSKYASLKGRQEFCLVFHHANAPIIEWFILDNAGWCKWDTITIMEMAYMTSCVDLSGEGYVAAHRAAKELGSMGIEKYRLCLSIIVCSLHVDLALA